MFLWEGSFLLATTILSGAALIFLTYRDQLRHHQLKIFFSNFSHDIKTSISRLRLQSDLIQEDYHQSERRRSDFPELHHLLENIARLDLQLENSLYFANLNESRFHLEDLNLSQLLESLRSEWQDVEFIFNEMEFKADRRAIISVLRNIFSNCVLHSKALQIRLSGRLLPKDPHFVEIEITSNGEIFSGNLSELGRAPLSLSSSKRTRGNGLGLYLSAELIRRMGGGRTLFDLTPDRHLRVTLTLPSATSMQEKNS